MTEPKSVAAEAVRNSTSRLASSFPGPTPQIKTKSKSERPALTEESVAGIQTHGIVPPAGDLVAKLGKNDEDGATPPRYKGQPPAYRTRAGDKYNGDQEFWLGDAFYQEGQSDTSAKDIRYRLQQQAYNGKKIPVEYSLLALNSNPQHGRRPHAFDGTHSPPSLKESKDFPQRRSQSPVLRHARAASESDETASFHVHNGR